MRVLVCGGRTFRSPAQVHRALDKFHEAMPVTELMEGGARGVDTFAGEWAALNRIRRFTCHADWKRYGNRAGPIRNARMLEWKPDVVIAFPGGTGTADMIRKARAAGVKVIEPLKPSLL